MRFSGRQHKQRWQKAVDLAKMVIIADADEHGSDQHKTLNSTANKLNNFNDNRARSA